MRGLITSALLLLVVLFSEGVAAAYIRGPRGGCYTITNTGRKRYVDHSLCGGPTAPTVNGQYHLGPRGGCYKITTSGGKRYVARSLCQR